MPTAGTGATPADAALPVGAGPSVGMAALLAVGGLVCAGATADAAVMAAAGGDIGAERDRLAARASSPNTRTPPVASKSRERGGAAMEVGRSEDRSVTAAAERRGSSGISGGGASGSRSEGGESSVLLGEREVLGAALTSSAVSRTAWDARPATDRMAA